MVQIRQKCARSWRRYRKLCSGHWKNFVLSDETMFYLDGIWAEKNVFDRNGEESSAKLTCHKLNAFTIGILTFVRVLYRDETENRIIDNGTKVN